MFFNKNFTTNQTKTNNTTREFNTVIQQQRDSQQRPRDKQDPPSVRDQEETLNHLCATLMQSGIEIAILIFLPVNNSRVCQRYSTEYQQIHSNYSNAFVDNFLMSHQQNFNFCFCFFNFWVFFNIILCLLR
jgi:hypothetical protein